MKCRSCGIENPDNAKFCVQCGDALSNNTICTQCGHVNEEGTKYCADCGVSLVAEGAKKKKSKKMKTKDASKTPIKKIWFILGGLFVALVLFLIWGFSTPKECRPLDDALDTNEEFSYGCDQSACYLWLQNLEEIEGVEIAYSWGDLEEKRGVCNPDPDSSKGLRCSIALPEETGSSLNISLATDSCYFGFATLTAEEINEVMADPDVQSDLSNDSGECADFQNAADRSLDAVNLLYSPVEIELWPITFDIPYLGLRYVWSNGESGAVDCTSDLPGEYYCRFPAEMGEPSVDFWLNDGTCESLQLTANEALLDWSGESYASCSEDFVNGLKEGRDQWHFTYDQDDTMADLFTFWMPGITEYKGATVLFIIDDDMDEVSADKCIVKENGLSGMPELGCYIMLEEMPEVVIGYMIVNESCRIHAGITETSEILKYLEANPN